MVPVSDDERLEIAKLVGRFESATGVQVVVALTRKADDYPEIPWKAFALGASLAGLVAALHPAVIRIWSDSSVAALDAMLILGCGALFAAAAAFVPALSRLFLDGVRAHGEALQYAKELFVDRELFRTRSRRAMLVVMCKLEGVAIIIADSGVAPYAPPPELAAIGREAAGRLRRGELVGAFGLALAGIEALLVRHGMPPEPMPGDELADDLFVGRSA
jgi:putative membrane protein